MPNTAQSRLREIPVRMIGPIVKAQPAVENTAGRHYHVRRRVIQAISLALVILIPTTGVFRFDPLAGALVFLDKQVWLSDFFLVFGLWMLIATSMVFLYSTAGTVFCGWVCPQNTTAEWANWITRRFLGKRAEVSLEGDPVRVTASKDHLFNWIALAACFLAASMVAALVPLLYFYPASAIWSFVTLRPDPSLAGSLYWIYGVFVLIVLLDVTMLRHFWCRFICIYRVWQHSFKTRQTLHVEFDASRSADCAGCDYCVSQCFIDLDPRGTDVYDSCINCGECIDACNRMHRKAETPGLLRFAFRERAPASGAAKRKLRNNEYTLLGRARWALPFGALGLAMFSWGLWSYQPYHLSVDHGAAAVSGKSPTHYQIAIANKQYHPATVRIHVDGLDPSDYSLSADTVTLGRIEHRTLNLSLSPALSHGLHSVSIEVRAQDGWTGHFEFQHFAG